MLTYNQGDKGRYTGWAMYWNFLSAAAMLGLAAFVFTHGPLVDGLMNEHPTGSFIVVWGGAMLSFHQDSKLRLAA